MDYYDRVALARHRLGVLSEELRQVERHERPPLGPEVSGLYADWCDAVAQVLDEL